ncbi:MAG: hypothetical protein WD403_13790 [Pirellulales bacterium]
MFICMQELTFIDEDDAISHLEEAFQSTDCFDSSRFLAMLDAAISQFPTSAEIWCLRGRGLELWSGEATFSKDDYRACYERAIEIDPGCAEAHQELAYLLDVYYEDFVASEQRFRTAIALGGGVESHVGLARVLAQVGRSDEAIAVLSEKHCPFANDAEVVRMRREILLGEWSPRS